MLPVVMASAGFTDVRPGLIILTVLTFVIVYFVLSKMAWRPIMGAMAEREKQIEGAIEAAKKERAEAEKLLADQKAAIAEARREAAEAMRKNTADMERFREELMAKSRKEAEELKADARRSIDEERAKAVTDIRKDTAQLAIQIAEKLLGENLNDAKHRALAEQFVTDLGKTGAAQPRA